MYDAAMSEIGNDLWRLRDQTVTLITGDKRIEGALSTAAPSTRTEDAKYWFRSVNDDKVVPFNEDDVESVDLHERTVTLKQCM